MPKLKQPTLIVISGLIWFAMGFWLFSKGINFLITSTKTLDALKETLIIKNFTLDPQRAQEMAIMFLLVALLVGYLKARVILSKTANRVIQNIVSKENPAPLSAAFEKKIIILILVMGGIGMLINFTGMPIDLRGFIDTAIGAALINGASFFFREAKKVKESLAA